MVEDNYQPAQPESAEEPKAADQPEDALSLIHIFCKGRFVPAGRPEKGQLAPPGGGKIGVLPGGVSLLIKREDRLGNVRDVYKRQEA